MSKKEYKPKKKHKGLIIFLIIFGILIVLPVGFVFGAFFTTSTKEVSNTTVHYENIVSESLHTGIKELKDEEGKRQLDFTIDEEMIDGIMMAACEKINQPDYIPKMYCYINENDYTFYADLQASFFKTRVAITTHLSTEGEGDAKQLVFKINNIKVGRLPIPVNWVTGILGNFLNDETLNNAFGQSGFHITSDLANAQLIYKRETFKEDVGVYLSRLGSNNPFLNVLLSVFGDESILKTNFNNGVTATFNLEPLQLVEGDTYYKEAPLEFTNLDKYKEDITNLLNYHGLEEVEGVPNVYTYLLRGYEESPDTVKQYINGLEDTDLGNALLNVIKDDVTTLLTQYNGCKCYNNETFEDYCADTIDEGNVITLDPKTPTKLDDLKSVTFSLPSDELNNVIASKLDGVIGSTTPITFKEGDLWYCDYVTVDNVYTGFKDPKVTGDTQIQFVLYFRLNISGVPVTVAVVTDNIGLEPAEESPNTSLGHLKFKIKDIYFGELKIKDSQLIEQILTLIPSDSEIFSYNASKNQFEVDIDGLLPYFDSAIKQIIAQFIKTKTPVVNDLDNDTFSLTYKIN